VSDSREIKTAWGGVPLKVSPEFARTVPKLAQPVQIDGSNYLVHWKMISDGAQKPVGMIMLPKNISVELNALQLQERFNLWVIGLSGCAAVVLAAFLVLREAAGRVPRHTLAEALNRGEGPLNSKMLSSSTRGGTI
jgi:hypothetical protein